MSDNSSMVKDIHVQQCAEMSSNWSSNVTDPIQNGSGTLEQAFHQPYDHLPRVAVLWVLAITGILGNALMMLWICSRKRLTGRRRRPAMASLVANLVVADSLVVVFATCAQLALEYEPPGTSWKYGDACCRLFRFLQLTSMYSSNYQVVVLAIDRLYAVRRPLHDQLTAFQLCGTAWFLAVAIAFGSLFLFKATCINGLIVCRNILYDYPPAHLQAYITILLILVIFLPFVAILICYACIVKKFTDKTSQVGIKARQIQLQATPSAHFKKARNKTLKMTIAIVALFIACSTPYCVCEIWRMFFDYNAIPPTAYSIMAAMAVSNSSVNPYIFLSFNARTFLKPARPATATNSRTLRTTLSRTRSANANEADNGEVIAMRNS